MKRQRWKSGSVLEIEIGNDILAYCQMLQEPEFAFFLDRELSQFLFRLWVHKSAYQQSRWPVIGVDAIAPNLHSEVPRFKKDPINGNIFIYLNSTETPSTHQECEGLECAAVWEPHHVEDRIQDHIQGRENKWVKSMALRP